MCWPTPYRVFAWSKPSRKSNAKRGMVQDRCLLYVFRGAVYFAGTRRHDPKKLNWWYWKD